jgi:hypothetical protein
MRALVPSCASIVYVYSVIKQNIMQKLEVEKSVFTGIIFSGILPRRAVVIVKEVTPGPMHC